MKLDVEDIAADLAGTAPGTAVYLNRRTGVHVVVTDGADWLEDDYDVDGEDWLCLPESHDRKEWGMMESFALLQEDPDARHRLERAIHGRGAFRAFKDAAEDFGLLTAWYTYLHEKTVEIVRTFLRDHEILFTDKEPPS